VPTKRARAALAARLLPDLCALSYARRARRPYRQRQRCQTTRALSTSISPAPARSSGCSSRTTSHSHCPTNTNPTRLSTTHHADRNSRRSGPSSFILSPPTARSPCWTTRHRRSQAHQAAAASTHPASGRTPAWSADASATTPSGLRRATEPSRPTQQPKAHTPPTSPPEPRAPTSRAPLQ
jgi:hypothetical protein